MARIELQIRPRNLLRDLDDLHESYVDAVNRAVAHDDLPLAEEIAAAYEAEVLHLVASRGRGLRAA